MEVQSIFIKLYQTEIGKKGKKTENEQGEV